MKQKSMTALVSTFARAYHTKEDKGKVFDDPAAELLLTPQEYEQVAASMVQGIGYFCPGFQGTEAEALKRIVNSQLAPSPLGRAAFAEDALQTAVKLGARQYLILGAGLDSFACRRPAWAEKLSVFELDQPESIADKQKRLLSFLDALPHHTQYLSANFNKSDWEQALIKCPDFHKHSVSFISMLGLSYYLDNETFFKLVTTLSSLVPDGSTIVFDYPEKLSDSSGSRAKKQAELASEANEKMCSGFSYQEIEQRLSDESFLIYEHLIPEEITKRFFKKYNKENIQYPITSMDGVNYCLAVKKT